MTITNTFSSGVNTSFSTELNDNFEEVFKYSTGNQTANSVSSTSESEALEVTITAGSVANGILVFAGGTANVNTSISGTIRLRAGTDTTATNNTQYKSITRSSSDTSLAKHGWSMVYYINDLTWASTNYVTITGFTTGGSQPVEAEYLEVIYL